MAVEKSHNMIGVNPYFRQALLLTFIKYQLDAKVQVHGFNVIGIGFIGIAASSHKADQIPGLHHIPYFQSIRKRVVFLQVGIIVIAFIIR